MLERSTLAENALECLHNENYAEAFERPRLDAATLISIAGRETRSLDGDWFFAIDPFDTGLRQRWYALEPGPRAEPWDYDPFVGETVPVPSSWNLVKPEWFLYEGAAWYTRFVDVETLSPDTRLFLRVGAANYDCKVFIDGAFVGGHRGASTPFCVEITDHLRPGRNWIGLCVDSTRAADRVPMRNIDWFNYGGIHRGVSLVEVPRHFLRDAHIRLEPGSDFSRVAVSLRVDGPDGIARVEIPEAGRTWEVPVRDGVGEAVLDWRPDLWSPESPRLYDVTVHYGEDRLRERIGFREIRRIGEDILLNGRPIFLRGIAVHEDDAVLGRVSDEADIRRRFAHARELNANFLRLAHYPHHERAAAIADELGLLLWEEIPVYWAIDFANPATRADAENQLRELIRRDRNRASVIVWGIGNETPDTDERLAFMAGLAAVCRELDGSRLVSAACLVNHDRLRIEDRLAEHLDVIGINEYYGWYEAPLEDLQRIAENSDPGKPVIVTEFGADGVAEPEGPRDGLFSEAYQCEVYRRQFAILAGIGWLKGTCPWILYDFRAERRQNIHQKGYNRKGLIAADKARKKPAFAIVSEVYAGIAATWGDEPK